MNIHSVALNVVHIISLFQAGENIASIHALEPGIF
jgi:hypothetical protein